MTRDIEGMELGGRRNEIQGGRHVSDDTRYLMGWNLGAPTRIHGGRAPALFPAIVHRVGGAVPIVIGSRSCGGEKDVALCFCFVGWLVRCSGVIGSSGGMTGKGVGGGGLLLYFC